MEAWQRACMAACRWLAIAGVLALVSWVMSDAEAQDQAKDAAAKGNAYFDDFDRDELGDQYVVVDPDPNRLTLNNGKLVILGTHPPKNVVLLEESFSGDFVATMTVTMEVAEKNFLGLRYHVDENNYLLVGVGGGLSGIGVYVSGLPKGRNPFFLRVVSGKKIGMAPPLGGMGKRNLEGFVPEVETWYLQLRRDGIRYTGFVSADGVRWTRIGSHDMVQFDGQLGFTVGSGSRGSAENAAQFDTFSVQQ